jgi:hypothetical protein
LADNKEKLSGILIDIPENFLRSYMPKLAAAFPAFAFSFGGRSQVMTKT